MSDTRDQKLLHKICLNVYFLIFINNESTIFTIIQRVASGTDATRWFIANVFIVNATNLFQYSMGAQHTEVHWYNNARHNY